MKLPNLAAFLLKISELTSFNFFFLDKRLKSCYLCNVNKIEKKMRQELINRICETLNGKEWQKNGIHRIYFNGFGYNTNKTRTTAYIQIEEGRWFASVFVNCPSQSTKWCMNEADKLTDLLIYRVKKVIRNNETRAEKMARIMRRAWSFIKKEGLSKSEALKKSWAVEKEEENE